VKKHEGVRVELVLPHGGRGVPCSLLLKKYELCKNILFNPVGLKNNSCYNSSRTKENLEKRSGMKTKGRHPSEEEERRAGGGTASGLKNA